MIWLPSGENATELTGLVCPCSSLSCSPVFASNTCTDWSKEPETIWLPSGENATELTLLVCPCSSLSCLPVFASHSCTDWSEEPETIWVPFLDNAMQRMCLLVVIVINGTVIVPLGSKIDGIKANCCLQCLQIGDCWYHV